jgi:FHA domain-containing protein
MPTPSLAAGGIPDDWNPFAPSPVAAPSAQRPGAQRSSALGLDMGAAAPSALIPELSGSGGGGDSLDALFGLKASGGGDPFAQSALAQPMAQPNMAAHADPQKSLGSAARATGETQTDSLSDLNRPFQSAPNVRSAAPAEPTPMAAPAAGAGRNPSTTALGMAGGAVLSWNNTPGDSHTVIRPGPLRDDPLAGAPREAMTPPRGEALPAEYDPFAALAPAPTDAAGLFGGAPVAAPVPAARAPAPAPAPFVAPTPAPPPAATAAVRAAAEFMAPAQAPAARAAALAAAAGTTTGHYPAARPVATADVQALTDAFREGLAAPDLKFETLTPELMRLIGSLLHEAASGTVDMLVARAALKRELRAESTMIVARENNPLKFSPTAEVALQHLLSPPARGFMAAAPAMRDAYTDLRAHQFGMVAGMRAALEGVLDRFDPAALEGQLSQRTMLQSLLSGSRKAKLWEMFVEHFSHIREEAADDFQNLFGKAFLRAYEEHIDQIDREGK